MTLSEMIKKYEKVRVELELHRAKYPPDHLSTQMEVMDCIIKDLKSVQESPTKDDIENEVRRAIMSALKQEEYESASSLIRSLEAMWS